MRKKLGPLFFAVLVHIDLANALLCWQAPAHKPAAFWPPQEEPMELELWVDNPFDDRFEVAVPAEAPVVAAPREHGATDTLMVERGSWK